MDSYVFLRVVGKGSYGEVHLVKHKSDRKQVIAMQLLASFDVCLSFYARNMCWWWDIWDAIHSMLPISALLWNTSQEVIHENRVRQLWVRIFSSDTDCQISLTPTSWYWAFSMLSSCRALYATAWNNSRVAGTCVQTEVFVHFLNPTHDAGRLKRPQKMRSETTAIL